MWFPALALAFSASLSSPAKAAPAPWYVVQYEDHGEGERQVVRERQTERDDATPGVVESSKPQYFVEHEPIGTARLITLESSDPAEIARVLADRGVAPRAPVNEAEELADEVMTLVDNGPAANRIDLVFMGDGYTLAERAKFYADIQRIVNDMFQGQTFASYLGLFNVHAVFRPSAESGIGTQDRPKNTAYKLAREGDTLRAIFMHDEAAARASCDAAPDCDYPVVIGNDPYYGGLGGEFAISTASPSSGTVVLRHELGHTIGDVGEEYDGGGYFGANTSASATNLKWRHWATATEEGQETVAEPVQAKYLGWPWYNLSAGPFSVDWTSDGRQARYGIWYSVSGIPQSTDLAVTLDGQPLAFRARGNQDRFFSSIESQTPLAAGNHTLKFDEAIHDGNNWVSNLTVFEYGAGYHYDNAYTGAYPTFAAAGRVAAYRPTHEACLMRNMESVNFCNVCKENLWLKFFAKVKLIDSVTVTPTAEGKLVKLVHQKLPLKIKWYKGNQEMQDLEDQAEFTMPNGQGQGAWEVRVEFQTPEVRQDTQGLLKGKKAFTL